MADKVEVNSVLYYEKDGSFSVQVNTAEFLASNSSNEATVASIVAVIMLPLLLLPPLLSPVAASIAMEVFFIIAATFAVTEAAFVPPYNYAPLTMVRKTTINLCELLWLKLNYKLD